MAGFPNHAPILTAGDALVLTYSEQVSFPDNRFPAML
jgi:hypothetical protein